MSKNLLITIYTKDSFGCNLANVNRLMSADGWSITDKSGKINFWNEKADEWEHLTGSLETLFGKSSVGWVQMHKGNQIIKICVNSDNSIAVSPEACPLTVLSELGKHFDFNSYYQSLTSVLDKNEAVIERFVFDVY